MSSSQLLSFCCTCIFFNTSFFLSFFLYFFFNNNNNEFNKLYTWMYLFVTSFFFLHNYQSLGQYSLADKIMIPGLFSQRVRVR